MADFNIDRIRFRWKNVWEPEVDYIKDDIVIYNGKAYVCLIGHTSDTIFYLDLNNDETRWTLMFDGTEWKSNWTTETYYSLGNLVKWHGVIYKCIEPHASATNDQADGLDRDIEKWEIVAKTTDWLNTWTPQTHYEVNDVVNYRGYVYFCNTKHLSSDTDNDGIEPDLSNWTILTTSDYWRGNWAPSTKYRIGDIAKYSGIVYRCIEGHVSNLFIDSSYTSWQQVISGIEYRIDWTGSRRYKRNDIVKYGGSLWRCIEEHSSQTLFRDDQDLGYWTVWVPGLEFEQLWSSSIEYQAGDIVIYGGYVYTALQNNLNSVPSLNGKIQDTGDWELLHEGYKHLGDWDENVDYRTGHVVRYSGSLYIAILDSSNEIPNGSASWQPLVTGQKYRNEWRDEITYFLGDIVTYKGDAYVCVLEHTSDIDTFEPSSTASTPFDLLILGTEKTGTENRMTYPGDMVTYDGGETRLEIGNSGTTLTVDSDGKTSWQLFGEINEFDEPGIGQVFYVSTDGEDSPNRGRSEGSPFRTVKYACQSVDSGQPVVNTTVITQMLTDIAAGDTVAQAEKPNLRDFLKSTVSGQQRGDLNGDAVIDSTDASLMNDIATGVTLSGTEYDWYVANILTPLLADIEPYLEEEVFSDTPYPKTTIFVKTGYYEEEIPIRIPRNTAVCGDELRSTVIAPVPGRELNDMFYMNNASGLRNLTVQGLNGVLGSPNEYLTRRPTAGAFVSLDPGSGPSDETAWIINRSPYVQNVTTFGTGCVGMKVDGALHEGGYKSIVANDFTQLISDGIGYWAANEGRSELVSVFTYYCHIGYLAETGGFVRATNGNNSYGDYGSVAEGVSDTETPITGAIDNKSNQAQVGSIINNGFNLLALGYTHAGEEYTSPQITLTGSGIDAQLEYPELRNGAISNIRIVSSGDSGPTGGLNYTYIVNAAQSGDTSTIQLSVADTTGTPETYVGQRLRILSGKGVGQYGEITSYDPITRLATISRESDGSSGFDHFSLGYPSAPVLDQTTRYAIEPKINVAQPSFSKNSYTSPFIPNDITSTSRGNETGPGVDPRLIAVLNDAAYYSTDGFNWTAGSIPSGNWDVVKGMHNSGTHYAVALQSGTFSNEIALTTDGGVNWSIVTAPTSANWQDVAMAPDGGFIAIAGSTQTDVLVSNDYGATWVDGTTLGGPYNSIAYGNGLFVAITNGNAFETSPDGVTWTPASLPITADFNHITYGLDRFVAVGDEAIVYSFNGITWYDTECNVQKNWSKVEYNAGVYFAITSDDETIATSQSAFNWEIITDDSTVKTFNDTGSYSMLTSAVIGNGRPTWYSHNGTKMQRVQFGAKAILESVTVGSRITEFRIFDPGSGYPSAPVISITDSQNTQDVLFTVYLKNGVLPQPVFRNRGTGWTRALGTISDLDGNGFAELYQLGTTLKVVNVTNVPGPGDNLSINGINDVLYKVVSIDSITGVSGDYTAQLTISPPLDVEESPDDGILITIRQRYSQIRLTGHDFLDIGTGNFISANYPQLYLEGYDFQEGNEPKPFQEVYEQGGGRVFYTSTDQDGNFRVGEFFRVEQATGIVTLNSSLFDFTGLDELTLGGISSIGSQVIIREFSKEDTFIANSNEIVPTQKAIARYVASRISGGGSDATTNKLNVGSMVLTLNNINCFDTEIKVKEIMDMRGGADGTWLASMYYVS